MISQICKTHFIFCFENIFIFLSENSPDTFVPVVLGTPDWTGDFDHAQFNHVLWIKFTASSQRAASDRFNISMLITPRMVKYGGVKWKPPWVAPALYFQKASYSSGGLVWAWAEVLAALAPASHPARTVIGRDSSLATSAHCLAAIT